MLARLARVFLAVALLAGWQAALLHPLEHVNAQGGFVHLANGQSGAPNSDGSKLCDALAALTACAPHAQLAFAAPDSGHPHLSFFASGQRVAEAPPFLSRGPPALL